MPLFRSKPAVLDVVGRRLSSSMTTAGVHDGSVQFEFQNDAGGWTPISDAAVNSALALVASGGGPQQYKANQHNANEARLAADGLSIEQTNLGNGTKRFVRMSALSPAFDFEDGARDSKQWKAVDDASAVAALARLHSSGEPQQYEINSVRYEARSEPSGDLIQKNLATAAERRVRAAKLAPRYAFEDGAPGSGRWVAIVEPSINAALHAAAEGAKGPRRYEARGFKYEARIEPNGLLVQRNEATGVERRVRPAAWDQLTPSAPPVQQPEAQSAVPVMTGQPPAASSSSLYPPMMGQPVAASQPQQVPMGMPVSG